VQVAFQIPKTSAKPLRRLRRASSLDSVETLRSIHILWRFYMFKKIAMILALAFSLAALASAEQNPLPGPPDGGGNIVLR
jgi:hypothetical protein